MSLLVAQLQNQDMYNTTDTSEFTNQMAQYSMIQSITDLVSISEDTYAMNYTSYAASLVGKEVTVAKLVDEELVTETGTITGVTLFEDEPMVYIGENSYSLSEIMVVGEVEDSTDTTDTESDSSSDESSTDGTTDSTETE
jgi:flagellar basal-body rod modification protein FlgD